MFNIVNLNNNSIVQSNKIYVLDFTHINEIDITLPASPVNQDEIVIIAPQIGEITNADVKNKKAIILAGNVNNTVLLSDQIIMDYPTTLLKLVYLNNNWYDFSDRCEKGLDLSVNVPTVFNDSSVIDALYALESNGSNGFTFRIGEVASGEQAVATNTGTPINVVLDLVLPIGPQGVEGIQGVDGEPGAQGVQGSQGAQGPQGIDPVQYIEPVKTANYTILDTDHRKWLVFNGSNLTLTLTSQCRDGFEVIIDNVNATGLTINKGGLRLISPNDVTVIPAGTTVHLMYMGSYNIYGSTLATWRLIGKL